MKRRVLICVSASLLLAVLVAAPAAEAQLKGFGEVGRFWSNANTIELSEDEDEGTDEGDDESTVYPAPVATTGQTECWDQNGTLIDCVGTGQDGEYRYGAKVVPRFTNNADGTVTDELTGLVWLRNANCFGFQEWIDALSNANTLAVGSCGLTDGSAAGEWRLPNVREMQSLFLYDGWSLAPDHPFSGVESYPYWTSTSVPDDWGQAFTAGLHGIVGTDWKADPIAPHYLWPVRGGSRFGGVNCNPRSVSPDCDLPMPDCSGSPAIRVPSVDGQCWGACVPITECRPLECEENDDCNSSAFSCNDQTNQCEPYTLFNCDLSSLIGDGGGDCPYCPPGSINAVVGHSCIPVCVYPDLCQPQVDPDDSGDDCDSPDGCPPGG